MVVNESNSLQTEKYIHPNEIKALKLLPLMSYSKSSQYIARILVLIIFLSSIIINLIKE